tara:strand:- start:79432 stop:79608 length:177 start_codon:yes stop_codon:yes gene_type:complete
MIEYLYTTTEAAKKIRSSVRSLERMRKNGTGPEYIQQGSRIFYLLADLKQWQQDNRKF